MGDDRLNTRKPVAQWDVAALLKLMWNAWNDVFRKTLGHAERTLSANSAMFATAGRTRSRFSSDDAYRALDSVGAAA